MADKMIIDYYPEYRLHQQSIEDYVKKLFTGKPIKVEVSLDSFTDRSSSSVQPTNPVGAFLEDERRPVLAHDTTKTHTSKYYIPSQPMF